MGKCINFLKSLTLWELLKGLGLTGKRLVTRKVTVQYPEEKNTSICAVSRLACVETLPQWRGAVHCM